MTITGVHSDKIAAGEKLAVIIIENNVRQRTESAAGDVVLRVQYESRSAATLETSIEIVAEL